MLTPAITEAYFFVDLPGESEPVVAGRLQIGAGKCRFIYGHTYLNRKDAFALDPINFSMLKITLTTLLCSYALMLLYRYYNGCYSS
ncbi:serine/threonine-protein kinase HipA [Neptunomonas antarctica]|uniref:Serine/threonine-protein kinase HipA n=1 Tax=Neptunomonas antarctica TaxID=619304 RepID=A0A1N7L5Q7_9GAMM|nr:serine/threonine-protein kinase HipA [Neptunomonas antarctica]